MGPFWFRDVSILIIVDPTTTTSLRLLFGPDSYHRSEHKYCSFTHLPLLPCGTFPTNVSRDSATILYLSRKNGSVSLNARNGSCGLQ